MFDKLVNALLELILFKFRLVLDVGDYFFVA